MANYERAKHDHDRDEQVFDGGDDDDGNEGSHLPVVIIIAILVLAAFGGVVWLAYNQGVARGRNDVPLRVAAATKTDNDSGIKVFQQRAGAEEDSATPPAAPAPAAQTPAAQTPTAQPPAAQTPAAPSAAQAQIQTPPAQVAPVPQPAPKTMAQAPVQAVPPPVTKPAVQPMAIAKPVPQEPLTATKPPAALGMVHPVPKPEAVKPAAPKPEAAKPVAVAKAETPAKPAVSGSYLLQIGAYKSDEEARAAWKADVGKHGTLLNGFGPDVQRFVKPDGSTWYRLRFGSFADRTTATALCERLKAQGRDCLVVK